MTAQAVERAGRSVARRGVVAWLLVRLTGLLLTETAVDVAGTRSRFPP